MPIFEVDGQQFEVEDKYVSDFAKEYPNAVTKVDSEDAIYEVSASDYPAYLDTQRAPRRVVPEKTTIPGSSAKPYQITPEEMGFENVLDKDNFQERYGVSPSVMERQTDPIKESVQRLRAKVGKGTNIGLGAHVGALKAMHPMISHAADFAMSIPAVNDAVSKVVPGVGEKIRESSILAATENELRGAEKAQSKDGFWKSFGKGLKNEGMWTQGLTELDNNLTLAYIAKKAEKEGFDKLPEKEQDLLTASALRIASEAAYSDEKTALQIAGMSTAESIPYMLQFMLTSSPASLATSPVRSAIKKAAEKAIKSGISSKLIPVVKGAARTAAVATKATAMTAMQPTMYADMVSRGTGRATLENGQYAGMEEAESAPMAAYKAFANATIENLSEHSGSMLSGVTKGVGSVLKKVPALGGFISNVQKNNVLSGVNKMMKAVGFNGAPEEFFEEQVSTGLNSLLVGDSQFSDFVDWKQQLATLISVGATAGAMTTTGTIMSVPYKKEIKRKYEEATDKVYDYFTPEEFDQFSSSLSRMDIDSRPDFIAQVSDMKGFAPEQIKGLVEFATRQAQFDGYAGAVSDYIEEEKVRAQEEIDRVSNKNMGEVLQVNGIGENPVNIVGGFVVFDDEGFVDKKKSSQTIYYLDEDGKRKMASPDKFGELVSRKPLADAYAEALGNVENDILIQEENDLAEEDTPEQAQQDAMILAENGNQVETPDGVGTISQVEQDENAAIVTFQDGKSKRYSIATLKPYVDPSLQPVENIAQTEGPVSQTEIQTEQPIQDVTQAPSFPVDKEGNIDYTQIQEPEQYAQALQQEFEGDAVSVIDEQIQSAQAKLEKAGKNADAIKKRRAMKAAQMELDRLNNVKSLLTPSEQIVNETIPNTVENEEASPSEQSNVTDLSQLTEPERRRYVVDNSTDPIELADIYEQSKDEVDYAQMMPWEAALVGRKVSKDSFIENSDKNNITGAMSRSWFSKDGKSLDVLAQELSEFGVPVTEQDIVNFMMAHPGNSVKKRSQLSIDADRRFKETVKALTGQDVGGVESSSGKLILAGLRAGQRSEQERQALPFSTYTIPDSVLNFFEETGINPEDFNTFEELRDAVAKEQENGTFVFPLGETDLQIINNIINHGIEQQQDYANFASRVEKAGTKRAIEQPVLETEAGNQLQPIEAEGKQVDIEPTPEEIAEIESQLEKPKRSGSVIGIINEIATEQNLRDAEKEVENNNNSNEVQETKSNYRTQDGKQLNFTFAEGLQNTNESASVESGSNDVQREGDPILGTLNRELKDGEFCKVERIFTESKSFDFTAGNYIDSVHDVAYIFKQLEDESVENSFAVLVKDGKPTIIHLGMGVYTSTQLNGTAILAAAERINPDKIFFIHNHPSGNLKPSQADKNVYSQLHSLFGDKLEDAIIINLKSGMFAIFNSNYDIEQTNYTPIKSNPVKVYSFNKQVFDKDYDPSGNFMITSPNDVASFISGHRLGNRKKMNIMIINNGVVANMFTKYTAVTDENVEEVAKESVLMATNYGGIAVVVYGDIGNIGDNSVSKLKKLIGIYSGGQISLLDFVSVEGNNYKSSIEEGLMETAQEYPTNKVNEDEILFRDGQSETDQIKSEAEKNGTFMKAPNGKPSNLNEKQWLQVRTKAFKEWFGDWETDPQNASKVVDENGEPKVVYHGSRNGEFDVFDPAKGNPTLNGGMYFSNSREMSNKFAGPNGKVYEVFLKIVDPSYGQFTGSGADMQKSEYRDGGIFRKTNDDKYGKIDDKEFIVFDPNQIKSATDNNGKFDPDNDDIRFRDAESNRLDKEYMDAVESGDMEKAQKIVDYVAQKNGYVSESDYRLTHRAPHSQPNTTPQQRFDEGRALSIEDMANGYLNVPEEYFDPRNGAQWYGYDTREGMESYRALMGAMREIKRQIKESGKVTDMPKVTVYRAVSKDVKEGSSRNGDWVSLSRSYAKSHGSAWVDGPSRIIEEEVPADQVWWDSNDINEFGVDDGKGYSYKNTKNNKKLNETVTRDDEGNIIPPSKRFNDRKNDVRYKDATPAVEQNEISDVEKQATTIAESLNTPIRIVRDVNEITHNDKRRERRMRSSKGWYDPKTGEVVIVLPNAESVGDVQATVLHEIVGHKGLRGLLGDKFEEMMDKVYKHLPKKERQKIMAAAMDKYKFDYRTATEEYLAEFVERDVMEPSLWQKIKSAIKSFFRNMGVNIEMSDPDIAYLLWKSKNRLQGGDALSKINSVAKDMEAKERFREAPYTEADVLSDQLDDASKRAWESLSRDQRTVHEMVNETAELRKGVLKYFPTKEGVKKSIYELTQGLFDNAVSLKALQNLVNEVSNEPIESYANPYQFLTTIPARNEHKMKTFVKTKFSKIGQAIKEMGVPQSTVQVYAYLKHGIERNRYMRGRDIEDKTRKLQEEAEKRIDPIRDSIEYLSQQLETADKKNTKRILAKIDGYNQAILDIQSETQVKASEYAQKVEDKDYSGVFQVADLFIQEMEDRKMTVAQIESAIEQFEKEHDTTNFWEAVNGATKWTVQNEFEMGRISKEIRDKIFSMYEYYIPLKGWEEENANEVWDYMSGQGIPVSPIKKAGGRKSLAQNPFENIGLAAQTSIMGGHKNLLKLHALRMVRNYPNKLYRVSEVWVVDEGDSWVVKAPEYSDNAETYAENVIKFEEEMNELKEQGLAKKVMGKLDVGKPITKYEAKEHEVLVYENGKPYIIYINDNPDIARAINMTSTKPYEVGGNDPSGKNGLKWAANQTMRLMRFTGQNMTSRFPGFIAANLLMDTQWAIAAATAKEGSSYAKKLVGNYMSPSIHRSIMRGIRGKLDESNPIDKLFGEFQRAGGETGYSDLFKVDDFEKMIKNELKEGVDWRKSYTWYTGSVDTLNRWAELASRFSTFVTSRNSGRDIERSAYDAKEITLNFNRKGTGAFGANWLRFAYLFAGAGLQGTYSMANLLLSKRSRKRITVIFAGVAMLGFLVPLINDLFLGGDDDDLYSKKPDYERKSNIMFRIPGSDSFLKLPLPQPTRPFYNIGESLYQMVKGNRNAGEGTMDIIAGFGMMLPFDPFGGSSMMMSALQPMYQIKENKDFFGQKIYKDDSFTQYDPEFKRAFSNTSPAFVELTRALNEITGGDEVTRGMVNVNPAILEHLVEGYLGGAFKFVNDIGKQVNGAIEVSKGNEYPYDSRSYPIVGRFYTNTAATSDINAEYYKVINDSEELSHRVRKYQELGRKGDQEAFEKSLELMNSPEYKKAIFVKAFKKRIDDLKKMAKDGNLEKNPVLKGQERELKIIMLNEIEKLDEK